MNFDQLQEEWKNEEVSAPEISLEHQKKTTNLLDKIRKNMRMEFWLNLISIGFIIPLSQVFSENQFVRWTLVTVICLIILYYTYKFHFFYKKFSTVNLDTFQSLLELKFELKMIKELYASYSVSFVPFYMGLLFLFLVKHDFFNYDDLIMHYTPFITFFFIIAFTLGIGVWWFEYYYGKYIKEIEKILKELK